MTANSWKEISAAVGIEVKKCVKRWRRIRGKFVRLKKTTKGSSGDAGGQKIPASLNFVMVESTQSTGRPPLTTTIVNIYRSLNSLFVLELAL